MKKVVYIIPSEDYKSDDRPNKTFVRNSFDFAASPNVHVRLTRTVKGTCIHSLRVCGKTTRTLSLSLALSRSCDHVVNPCIK